MKIFLFKHLDDKIKLKKVKMAKKEKCKKTPFTY